LAAFVMRAYELDPNTGRRKIHRAFLSRSKGRAKSELAAMLVCADRAGRAHSGQGHASGEDREPAALSYCP
jgi:hypothetical protein